MSPKSIEGTLGCIIVCIGLVYICNSNKYWAGVVSGLAETLSTTIIPLNDNIFIPIVSGLAFGGLQNALGELQISIKIARKLVNK